jgi:hypothetical protein
VDTLIEAEWLAPAAGLIAGHPLTLAPELLKRYQRELFPVFAYPPRLAKCVPVHRRPLRMDGGLTISLCTV